MERNLKKVLSYILAFTLTVASCTMITPTTTVEASTSHSYNIENGSITINSNNYGSITVSYNNGSSSDTFSYYDTIIIYGSTSGNKCNTLTINTSCNVQLSNLTISNTENTNEVNDAIRINSSATNVYMKLYGTSTVRGGNQRAGIFVAKGASLHIYADDSDPNGTLYAFGGSRGAGIGANQEEAGGYIEINSGTIHATGGQFAAGIGGGDNIGCQEVRIKGGNVYAYGGQQAAAIGTGANDTVESIYIEGGNVTAVGGSWRSGIGSSTKAGGVISITGGTINATGSDGASGITTNNSTVSIGENASIFSATDASDTSGASAISGKNVTSSAAVIVISALNAFSKDSVLELKDENNNVVYSYTATSNWKSIAATVTPGTYYLYIKQTDSQTGEETETQQFWGVEKDGVLQRTAEFTATANAVTEYNLVRYYTNLSNYDLTLSTSSYTYDGNAKTPSVTVTNSNKTVLTEGTDYTVSYTDNTNAGTATVTITGIGDYMGTITGTYTINKASNSASVNAYAISQTEIAVFPAVSSDSSATIAYTYEDVTSGASDTDTHAIDTTLTEDGYYLISGLTAGHTYKITSAIAESCNFTSCTATTNVTTANKTKVTLSVTKTGDVTYTGYAQSGYTADSISVASYEKANASQPDLDLSNDLVVTYQGTNNTNYPSSTTAPTNAGTYLVTISVKSSNEYYVGSTSFTYTINKAELTVTVNNASTIYGEVAPAFTSEITGFVNGETANVLSGSLTYTCNYYATSNAGEYDITAGNSTLSAQNYTITYAKGILKVNKRPITVSWGSSTLTYTGYAQTPSMNGISYTGNSTKSALVGSDVLSGIAGAVTEVSYGNSASITIVDNNGKDRSDNYDITNKTCLYSISYLTLDNGAYSIEGTLGNKYDESSYWYTSTVLVRASSLYQVKEKDSSSNFAQTLTFTRSVNNAALVFMNSDGYLSDSQYLTLHIDTDKPEISFSQESTSSGKDVTITATDATSGLASIAYLLSAQKLTSESTIGSWTSCANNTKLSLTDSQYLYVKVTDKAGNTS